MILGQVIYRDSPCDSTNKSVSIHDPSSRKSSSVFLQPETEKKPAKIKPVLVMRYLGTTPDSSALCPMLISLCQQVIDPFDFHNI